MRNGSAPSRLNAPGKPKRRVDARRELTPAAAQFFGRIYLAARAGCCRDLRRVGCTEEEAEEIFMATCEKVMRTVDPIARRFDPGQMVNLLKVSCKNRLIDERRHRARLTEVSLEKAGSVSDASASSPDDTLEDHETIEAGREAIACLAPDEQKVFLQRHQLGLSPSEIQRVNPSLSPRSYRRTLQRANAKVLASFEEIESGERCEAVRLVLLKLEIAGKATPETSQIVKAHLDRCRGCRRIRSRMLDQEAHHHRADAPAAAASIRAKASLRGTAPS